MGLYRVQKSVFLGDIEDNVLDELAIHLKIWLTLIQTRFMYFLCQEAN